MRTSAIKYTVLSWVSGLTMLILLLMPFHALLTVWGASLVDHYTALRLWKEVLLFICIIGALYLIITDHKIRTHTLSRRLVWLILAYMALNLVWAGLAVSSGDVTAKAAGYGLIINLRFLAFFLVTWTVALRMARLRSHWQWLVYWPAMGVIFFGLLQIFLLPNDFLKHFGYGSLTIPPFETVNNNPDYVRIMSTLRGPNPLGAYLLIPISLLVVLLLKKGRTWLQAGLLVAAAVVLFFSFSRSALIGAGLSVVVILFLAKLSRGAQRLVLIGAAGLVLVTAVTALALNNNSRFENFVFHTEDNSKVQTSSNGQRLEAIRKGSQAVLDEPMGTGPGSAGPASIYNKDKTNISENYFIQIGQETGIIGLVMFIAINAGVAALLFVRRDDPLALSLFASLVGLTFINLLSHAWTDDTLAYVWWGLAGVAMAPNMKLPKKAAKSSETS